MPEILSPRRELDLALLLLVAIGLAGCAEPAVEAEVLRPVRGEVVRASQGGRLRTFSGTAQAGQETDLSFRVGGTVDRLEAKVGDRILRGELIARLDDTDYRIAVRRAEAGLKQAQATARNADADLERVRGLWENNNTSQNDLDSALAQAQSARAQVEVSRQTLAGARLQLDYTRLRSPVDGSVAAVDVEVNENIRTGQPIVRLTSGTRPEVEVGIPEMLIAKVAQGDAATVTFSAWPDARFDAVVTEVGVAATGGATTFPVTARLADEAEGVRSGMAADVTLLFGDDDDGLRIFLPAYAVGEDAAGAYVFVLEPTDETGVGRVHRTPVEIGRELTAEGRLEVLDGVVPGQRVVTAGVRRLTDGQRVRLLATGESG